MFVMKSKLMQTAPDGADAGIPAPSNDEGSAPEYASVFEEMAGDILGEELVERSTPASTMDEAPSEPPGATETPPAAPVVEKPAATEAPAAEAPPVTPAPEEKKDGEQPPAVTEPPPAATTPISKTPAEIQAEYNSWLQTAETQLADQNYRIDETLLDEFNSNPEKALPRILAKAHLQIQQATMMAIAEMFPKIMETYQRGNSERERIETQFFGMWPGLAPVKEKAVVDAVPLIENFRRANPQIDEATLMKQVGATLHVMYQIPVDGQTPPPADPVQSMPPARAPTSAPGSRPNPQAPRTTSWTEELAAEFKADD